MDNKNFDPRTEEGYRNIVETLATIRKDAKNSLWRMYSAVFGVDVDNVLDFLYKQATDIYNQGKVKVEVKLNEAKDKLNEKLSTRIDELVDEYIDDVLVPNSNGKISRKSINNAHDALANFAKWVLTK